MNERELFEKTNSRTLSGAYYFAGSEELTKQQAIDRILALLDPGFFDLRIRHSDPFHKEQSGFFKDPQVVRIMDDRHLI